MNLPMDIETARLLLDFIAWVARQIARLRGPNGERLAELESEVLHYLAQRNEWTTPGLIWADLILLPILKDVRFDEAFPPETRGWPLLKWRMKNFRVNVRHRWRRWRQYVPEETVQKITRRLWRENRLRRAPWDELYRVRYE